MSRKPLSRLVNSKHDALNEVAKQASRIVNQPLSVSIGQYSATGRKSVNQDYVDFSIPKQPLLSSKGIALGIADGISSSDVSQIASRATVQGFLADYYATSEAWTVQKSATQVLNASNAWLHSQTKQSPYRFDKDRGYVCTFSGLILKSRLAHILHIGDTRIYRLRDSALECLTEDHRFWVSSQENYLARAMGMQPHLDLDYKSYALKTNDVFFLMSDGIYEYVNDTAIISTIQNAATLELAAKSLYEQALANGSTDNLTVQICRVDSLPEQDIDSLYHSLTDLPFPPELEARSILDGYEIIRTLHTSSRSHVYLAIDQATQTKVVIKTPSMDLRGDAAYLERFLLEEWIARRINNAHVLKPNPIERSPSALYVVMEYIEGQTLYQWMLENPNPSLDTVRGIVEQIAKGLQAFHRMEMLHQDLRPQNIMIDMHGTVKIIDFGATRVAGLAETYTPLTHQALLGTAQYSAPEYFVGDTGNSQSDLFSLAAITYEMLTGQLPYGATVARTKSQRDLERLSYTDIRLRQHAFPAWADHAIARALHPIQSKRYEVLSEFIHDLRQPNQSYLNQVKPALLERHPVEFWRGLSILLMLIIIYLLAKSA